jgi:hypothetical protein
MDRLGPGEVSFVRAVTEPAAQAPYRGTVAGGGRLIPRFARTVARVGRRVPCLARNAGWGAGPVATVAQA